MRVRARQYRSHGMHSERIPARRTRVRESKYGGRTPKGSPAVVPAKGVLLFGCRVTDVLRRHTDDFHAGTARDVHRFDYVLVFHSGVTLHENDFLGTGIVDLPKTLE